MKNRIKKALLNVGVSAVVLFGACMVGALAIVCRISDRLDQRFERKHRYGR